MTMRACTFNFALEDDEIVRRDDIFSTAHHSSSKESWDRSKLSGPEDMLQMRRAPGGHVRATVARKADSYLFQSFR